MPTILWFGNLRVVIYPHDHLPEHVHVIGPDCEAVFELHCPAGPVTLRESYGFKTRRLRHWIDELTAVLAELCSAWERIHEPD
jgi:hypothetical protein